MKDLPKLSEAELKIMMAIWNEENPVYLENIIESLKEENWAESTIRNFLARIIEKGYLETKKDGRKNIYYPLITEDYINKESKGIISRLYDNSLKKFVVELYESDSLEYDDLVELKKYLDEKIDER